MLRVFRVSTFTIRNSKDEEEEEEEEEETLLYVAFCHFYSTIA
jgi:hypothetical protein